MLPIALHATEHVITLVVFQMMKIKKNVVLCIEVCVKYVPKNVTGASIKITLFGLKPIISVKKTYEELKRKYEIAQQEEQKHRSVLGEVKNAFSSLGSKVKKMVHDVRGYLNKLNEIALRPNPLSDIDYIDLLIESEKNEESTDGKIELSFSRKCEKSRNWWPKRQM